MTTDDASRDRRPRPAVTVIGLGRVGSALVPRLVAAGHDVIGYDIDAAKEDHTVGAGAHWVSDPGEAIARAGVVLTVLPGTPELRELVLDADALLPHLSADAIWVDLTSTSPAVSVECAQAAERRGRTMLDAPIGGGPRAVAEGSATLYVGVATDVVDVTQPVLASFAGTIHHVGGHGSGHLVKLLINVLWFNQVGVVTEALLLAKQSGIRPTDLRELLRGSAADSAFVERDLPALLRGDYLTEFGLDRCVEEIHAVEQQAVRSSTPHDLISATAHLYDAALERFGAIDGELLAAAHLEGTAGVRLRDPT